MRSLILFLFALGAPSCASVLEPDYVELSPFAAITDNGDSDGSITSPGGRRSWDTDSSTDDSLSYGAMVTFGYTLGDEQRRTTEAVERIAATQGQMAADVAQGILEGMPPDRTDEVLKGLDRVAASVNSLASAQLKHWEEEEEKDEERWDWFEENWGKLLTALAVIAAALGGLKLKHHIRGERKG